GSTSGSVEAGAFLGFFAALGIAAGGYVTTDGKAIDRLKALLPSSSGASGGFPAAPPPSPVQPQAAAPTPSVPAAAPPAVTPPPPPSPAVPPPAPESSAASAEPAEASSPPAAPEVTSPPESDRPAEAQAPAAERVEEDPRSVFCEGCGAPLRAADRFCRKCGHKQAPVTGPDVS
ncbi:MAG TPA: zinc ribbon domain-containing protein, partial [Solirubrobacterales bacterium]|nr:zinc ribbon domain-containing protein [Solirubrobacterales bacterium]